MKSTPRSTTERPTATPSIQTAQGEANERCEQTKAHRKQSMNTADKDNGVTQRARDPSGVCTQLGSDAARPRVKHGIYTALSHRDTSCVD